MPGLLRYSAAPLRGWMDQSRIAGTKSSAQRCGVPAEDFVLAENILFAVSFFFYKKADADGRPKFY
jgi:hypothetical protein